MRLLVFLVALLSAVPSFADPFQFEPKAPVSTSAVVLRVDTIWDGCVPRNAQVTRNNESIDVLWSVPRTGACVAAFVPWSDRVSLGVLSPGRYDVTMRVDSRTGLQTLGTKSFIVAEGNPVFTLDPPAVGLGGGFVEARSLLFCVQSPSEIPKVLVDGVPIQYQVDPCAVVLFMPPHAAGPVDISIQVGETTHTVRSTFRYLDAHATPDEAVFERVLVPVLSNGPGANGSQWETRGTLRNIASSSLRWFSDVARPSTCGTGDCLVAPTATLGLSAFGEHPKGLVLFVPRTIANDIHYGLVVRDTSREGTTLGTEVRVVRERDASSGKLVLENVPLDSRYRTTLRIYAIDGGGTNVKVTALAPQGGGAAATVQLDGCDLPPCNSAEPGFGSFDLRALFPQLTQTPSVTLFVEGDARPRWALVSVTNNATQQVTTISPQ
jgi:hypothetical protein